MNTNLFLKNIVENIPYTLGKWTSYIPFNIRLGNEYKKFSNLISHYETASDEEQYNYLLEHLCKIVKYAQINFPFYQNLYGKKIITIKTLGDFEALPIIKKSQVREFTKDVKGATRLNTGGSTEGPLPFYVDKNIWAREWAHMHHIWSQRVYKPSDLMITMMGKNIGLKPFRYNAVHNELLLNPYVPINSFLPEILEMFKQYPIKYFQGYPSNIYSFFKELEHLVGEKQKRYISAKIQSLFFSSEYPMPYMIKYLKDVWSLDSYISWYGLSEMCVLASDNNSDSVYKPFITYGFAENVNGILLGTSFHNFDMPLIRYSTEDSIKGQKNKYGIMTSFKITKGRSGDFMIDKHGRKLSLTFALGRHHEIYDIADFIQLYQERNGEAIFYITFKIKPLIKESEAVNYFDLKNIDIDFKYKFLREPIRTKLGKFKLKLNSEDILPN
jgi:phenylacetate-CoA ligase